MTFKQLFNRALDRSHKFAECSFYNGGLIKYVDCKFSFTVNKVKYYYKLEVNNSAPSFAIFGYDEKYRNQITLWRMKTGSYCSGESEPQTISVIKNLDKWTKLVQYTPEEESSIYNSTVKAVAEFDNEMNNFYATTS